MKKTLLVLALIGAGCAGASDADEASQVQESAAPAAAPAAALSAEASAMLDNIRTATAKYSDVAAALADGFIPDPTGHCVRAEDVGLSADRGAMGIHYAHMPRLGVSSAAAPVSGSDGALDWNAPEVLVYEPQADGSLRLVAVEYLVFQDAWQAAGNTAPPTFFETAFFSMGDDPATTTDEAHGFAPHYELHMWLQAENPAGVFAEFNPSVTCAHASPTHAAGM